MIVLIIPTVFNSTVGGTEGEKGVEQLSHVAAIVLLLLYGLFLYFQFKSHVDLFATETHHHLRDDCDYSYTTILVSWMAEVLVHSVEYAADDMGATSFVHRSDFATTIR